MSGINYPRIPEEQYQKLLLQLRGQFVGILYVFRCYGLDAYVDQAIEECIKVTENFAMTVRGKNKPIHILSEPKARATEE